MNSTSHSHAVCVVLVSTRNPLNIGAAARAISNFGFNTLRLVKPYDPSFREAKSAVGAADVLASAKMFDCVAEAVADCSLVIGTTAAANRELQHPLKTIEAAACEVRSHLSSGNAALLFGSEKRGLANEDLAYCHFLARIPTREAHGSMNLGQAVAVCLYEIARGELAGRNLAPNESAAELASGESVERVTQLLFEALQKSGYVKPQTQAATEEKLRRMVRRLQLQVADAEDVQGMLRKILYKLDRS